MPKNLPFVHKLLHKLEKVDPESLQKYLLELATARALYENVFRELQEGIILTSREGEIFFFNPPAAAWLGLPENPKSNPSLLDISDTAVSSALLKSLKNLQDRKTQDFRVLLPREREIHAVLVPMQDFGGALILLAEIPSQGKTKGGGARTENIEALLSLAAGVAHEIGNPLNAISIHLALLQKEIKTLPDPKRKNLEKTLEVLAAETGRLDKIVRNFLKASRKPPLRFKTEDLNRILEASLDFMRPELAENKVAFSFKPDNSLPSFLMDRERLHQTFINLIKNAMEAMPAGGRLDIRTTKRAKAAILVFKDTGEGISEESLPHIFDAYYTTKTEGSGLGLMSVWKTVAEHGGRIEVASKVGQGTTFTILLPIREPKFQLPHAKGK